ncbi:MAG: type II secretion system GspH family protein [Burkholderiaceae bacterium]|nr:type II secretion system GspH family protein [Burkholderiaceae bacterium]
MRGREKERFRPLSQKGDTRGKERGFSLLEILVAFAIAAMALGLLYQIMGSNARQVGDLAERERAVLLAESLLDIQRAVPEAGLNESGQAAGYVWQIDSRPYPTPVQQAAPNVPPLHEVRVTVQWGEGAGRQFTLASLRPQARPLPPGVAP